MVAFIKLWYQYTLQWHVLIQNTQIQIVVLLAGRIEVTVCPRKEAVRVRARDRVRPYVFVSWAGWRRCYLLPVSPLWPLTNHLTGMTGRRLSDSHWLPSHCLGSNSRQLAWSLWGRFVRFACVHVCNGEVLTREHAEMCIKMYKEF